eukprot:765289-Hanusia_phi.AAC.4
MLYELVHEVVDILEIEHFPQRLVGISADLLAVSSWIGQEAGKALFPPAIRRRPRSDGWGCGTRRPALPRQSSWGTWCGPLLPFRFP